MNSTETLLAVRMEASLRKFEKQMERGRRTAERQSKAIEGRLDKMRRRVETLGVRAGRGLGAIGVGAGAAVAPLALMGVSLQQIAANGDKLNLLKGRLEAITGSADTAASGVEGILDILVETGASLDTGAASFTRFTQAGKALGATQKDILQLTETVLKLGQIGGASTQELSAGSVQLSQALASGVLRGDELNSVMENLPALTDALATSLGVGVGELRAMAEAGELTARRVFDALLSKTDETNRKFADLPVTIEVASGRMAAAWTRFTAKIDDSIGLSQTLANILDGIAAKFDRASASGRRLVESELAEAKSLLAALEDRGEFAVGGEAGLAAARAPLEQRIQQLNEVLENYNRNDADVERAAKRRAKAEAEAQAEIAHNLFVTNQERERSIALMDREARAIKLAGDAAVKAYQERVPGASSEAVANIRAFAEATKEKELSQSRSSSSKRAELSAAEKLSRIYVDELETLNDRRQLIGKTANEAARLRAETAARNRLLATAQAEGLEGDASTLVDIELYALKIGEIAEMTYVAEQAEKDRREAIEKSKEEAEALARATDQANAALIDGLTQAAARAETLTEALQNVAIELLRIAASDFFKGAFGLKSGGSTLGSAFHQIGASVLGGLLGGPSVKATGSNGIPFGFASGGEIRGPGGPRSDSVPIMASNGEFIVNAKSAKENAGILRAINAGRVTSQAVKSMPRMADGGFVGRAPSASFHGGDVIIHNHTPARVEAEQRVGSNGRRDVMLRILDDANASNISDPGSKTNRALRGSQKVIRR